MLLYFVIIFSHNAMSRPTFHYDEKPVRAGGVLFYATIDGKRHYLLRKGKKHWGDIGGKTEISDKSIMDMLIREVTEETNNVLFDVSHTTDEAKQALSNHLENTDFNLFYCEKAKYILLRVEVDASVYGLDMSRFGTHESTGKKMSHSFSWVHSVDLKTIHPRIKYSNFCHSVFN